MREPNGSMAMPPGTVPRGKKAAGESLDAVLLKIVIQPCVAFVLGRYAVHLSRPDLLAVVVCSALPTAQNVFIFVGEYDLRTALVRNAIVWNRHVPC